MYVLWGRFRKKNVSDFISSRDREIEIVEIEIEMSCPCLRNTSVIYNWHSKLNLRMHSLNFYVFLFLPKHSLDGFIVYKDGKNSL